jgi:hypothetical protein
MAEAQIYEITLTALAYGGRTIGKLPDGQAVFTPYGLRARVQVRLVEEKRRHARGEIVEIWRFSRADRCAASISGCAAAATTSTCREAQLAAKTAILKDQLEHRGFAEPRSGHRPLRSLVLPQPCSSTDPGGGCLPKLRSGVPVRVPPAGGPIHSMAAARVRPGSAGTGRPAAGDQGRPAAGGNRRDQAPE